MRAGIGEDGENSINEFDCEMCVSSCDKNYLVCNQ